MGQVEFQRLTDYKSASVSTVQSEETRPRPHPSQEGLEMLLPPGSPPLSIFSTPLPPP